MVWAPKELPKYNNGFRIIKDLSRTEEGTRHAIVECKICYKEFRTSVYGIYKLKSCGCLKKNKIIKPGARLYGFMLIKDLGWSSKTRKHNYILECKFCKKEFEISNMKVKKQKSCGCMNNGGMISSYIHTHPRLMRIFRHMKARCYKAYSPDYKWYGKKGIRIFQGWLDHPDNFCKWALENGYSDNLTIDRIDGDKDYEPNNCRWTDIKTQIRNRNYNKLNMELANQIRKDKLTMITKDIMKKYNISHSTIANVINNKSWV